MQGPDKNVVAGRRSMYRDGIPLRATRYTRSLLDAPSSQAAERAPASLGMWHSTAAAGCRRRPEGNGKHDISQLHRRVSVLSADVRALARTRMR